MIVVGLTGSIGMGKSTTAAMFERQGAPVYDADAEVRRLYAAGGAAVAPVEAAFPGVIVDGGIDRGRLSERVVGNREALARLNGVVWPLMGAARANFLKRAREVGTALAVLDIPLLFETGGQGSVDVVVVVTASAAIQRERVMGRPGMNEEKFAAMLAAQTPDAEKRARADFIVDTGRGLAEAENQVRDIVDVLRGRAETAQ